MSVQVHNLLNLRARRVSAGWTQDELARRSGVALLTIQRAEHHAVARYAHPTEERKLGALDSFDVGTTRSQSPRTHEGLSKESPEMPGFIGGRHEARTRDLSVANAALSQLS
jgi:transcriptional regulator with XRE-family HTH domain